MAIVKHGNITSKTSEYPARIVQQGQTEIRLISNGSLQSVINNVAVQVDGGYESITYTNSNGKLSNLCIHKKVRTTYGGDATSSCRFDQPGSGVYYISRGHHRHSINAHASAVTAAKSAFGVSLGANLLGAGGQGYINEIFADVRPDLTTVSVPNFLIEIGQIKDLFKLWKQNVSLARNVAGAHLNYKFGWKPTIGDVQAMVNSVRSFQQKLKAFEDSLNVLLKGKQTVFSDSISKNGSFSYTPADGVCYWSGTVVRSLTGAIAYRPLPLQAMSNVEKTLRGLLDTLGVQLNPRIVWDALPFTFVIDWFFGVGKWLESFSIDTLELPIKCVDSYLQYKEELRIDSYVKLDTTNAGITPKNIVPSTITSEKYFQRMAIMPDQATWSGLGWRRPTGSQLTLLASLGVVLSGKK